MSVFQREGYEHAEPPMLEFEDSFLAGGGDGLTRETFRMMDPQSQRMLALRSDMTPQMARLAATRLASAPRPLRLCYAGSVLRVSGGSNARDRQLRQAGAELFGSRAADADAEIVLLAVAALEAIGIANISVDLNVPRMAGDLTAELGLSPSAKAALMTALDRKDMAEMRRLAPGAADMLTALTIAGGRAEAALEAAQSIALPAAAAERLARMAEIVALIRAEAPELDLTIDFVEHRGFDYHTGVAFSLFAAGHDRELGHGGRYRAPALDRENGEPAVGFSLFMDAVEAAAPDPEPPLRVYTPKGMSADERMKVHAQGYVTVRALEADVDAHAAAEVLQCAAYWRDGDVIFLKDE
jgi:ATP phosphoribosyltransferase regulatory subunit